MKRRTLRAAPAVLALGLLAAPARAQLPGSSYLTYAGSNVSLVSDRDE